MLGLVLIGCGSAEPSVLVEPDLDKLTPGLATILAEEEVTSLSLIVQSNGDLEGAIALFEDLGGEVRSELKIIGGFSGSISSDQIASLSAQPVIKYISLDEKVSVSEVEPEILNQAGLTELAYTAKFHHGSTSNEHNSFNGSPIQLNDVEYANGVATRGKVTFELTFAESYNHFSAAVGLNRAEHNLACDGEVEFKIKINNHEVYKSPRMSDFESVGHIEILQNMDPGDEFKIEIKTHHEDKHNPCVYAALGNPTFSDMYRPFGSNLLTNGGFESDMAGWDIDKKSTDLVYSTNDLAQVYEGAAAMVLVGDKDHAKVEQKIDIEEGITYIVSGEALRLGQYAADTAGYPTKLKIEIKGKHKSKHDIFFESFAEFESFTYLFIGPEKAKEIELKFEIPKKSEGVQLAVDNVSVTAVEPGDWPEEMNTHLEAIGADQVHNQGVTGKDITVAVVDSGVNDAVLGKTLLKDVSTVGISGAQENGDFEDRHGHGTLMAGIIGNAIQGGVAPDANIISVQVLDGDGKGTVTDLLEGLNYVYSKKNEIDVVNLSIQGNVDGAYWANPINAAVQALWDAGIVVVVSAGNVGPDPITITTPGNDPYVITVGAFTDNYTPEDGDDDYIPPFSSSGPTEVGFVKPDVIAPGAHVNVLLHKRSNYRNRFGELHMGNQAFRTSGTSSAAAVTSGLVALMLAENDKLTPNEVKYRLMMTAQPLVDENNKLAVPIFRQGTGKVSAYAAVFNSGSIFDGEANLGMISGQPYVGPVKYDELRGGFYLVDADRNSLPEGEDMFWSGGNY
ncbi:MAG: S8 family serine peptidase, partial [Chloroflexota bacterium]